MCIFIKHLTFQCPVHACTTDVADTVHMYLYIYMHVHILRAVLYQGVDLHVGYNVPPPPFKLSQSHLSLYLAPLNHEHMLV